MHCTRKDLLQFHALWSKLCISNVESGKTLNENVDILLNLLNTFITDVITRVKITKIIYVNCITAKLMYFSSID